MIHVYSCGDILHSSYSLHEGLYHRQVSSFLISTFVFPSQFPHLNITSRNVKKNLKLKAVGFFVLAFSWVY